MSWTETPFHIEYCDILNKDPRWTWDTDGYAGRAFVLWLIVAGKGTLRSGDDLFALRQGDCIISPLWQPHHGRNDPDDLLVIYWARFSFVSGEGAPMVPDPLPPGHRRIGRISFLRDIIGRSVTSFGKGRAAEAYDWLTTAFREIALADEEDARAATDGGQYRRILAIAEKIKAEPQRPWLLEELSASMGLGRDHFVRVFHHCMGQTPHRYIVGLRIEEAC